MVELKKGDCIEVMKEIEDNSVDLILCDPPYEIGFLGKKWDDSGIAFNSSMWREAYRVLKPNGYCLAFSGARTYHRMTKAIEEANFEIQGISEWVYGNGFPKPLDLSKALDKKSRAERKVIGTKDKTESFGYEGNNIYRNGDRNKIIASITAPATDIAELYEGYKTQLKPSKEPIIIAQKKLEDDNKMIDFLPFMYCAKASKRERSSDIYGNKIDVNNHPTVKPLNIIKQLFGQAIDKDEMVVLDMFAGSGTTGVAIEQFNIENNTKHKCILIEKEKEYAEIIKNRCCLEEV